MSEPAQAEDRAALERARVIARELGDIDERLQGSTSSEVTLTLIEHATELAEEAARLLEQVGRAQP